MWLRLFPLGVVFAAALVWVGSARADVYKVGTPTGAGQKCANGFEGAP